MKVLVTPGARMQFFAALEYIHARNRSAALRFRRRVEATLKQLKRFPRSGRGIPEFPDLPYREVIVPPYRFFYRIQGKIVWIVAVWHGAQIPSAPTDATAD